jgi:nucleoside-diphosphate-sugar epimerase
VRILIIGGTSFIGPHVARKLQEAGHAVTVFHRGISECELPQEINHIHGDQARMGDFSSELLELSPTVVLHMVPASAQDAWTFVRTFRGIARRLVIISSIDVYRAYNRLLGIEPGPPDPVPLKEDSPLREVLYPFRDSNGASEDDPEARRWGYDYDKILVEKIVMQEPGLPGTILRLPVVYGPFDRQQRLFHHIKRMDDRRPAILLSEEHARWRWSRAYVENVAHAITLAVTDERAARRIYNIAEQEAWTEIGWVTEIAKITHWEGNVVTLPEHKMPQHLKQDFVWEQDLVADSSRIRRELGYEEIVPLDEGLRRTIAWERANSPSEVDEASFDYPAEDKALASVKPDRKLRT